MGIFWKYFEWIEGDNYKKLVYNKILVNNVILWLYWLVGDMYGKLVVKCFNFCLILFNMKFYLIGNFYRCVLGG